MALVEPVPDEPAAIAHLQGERALLIADFHAGIESALRYDGVEIDSQAENRRERLVTLVHETSADRVIILGDLAHWIGEPAGVELDEITALIDAVTDLVPMTLVKGNHDGKIEDAIDIPVSESTGLRVGDVGFIHGNTHPAPEVVTADVVCVGHEHVTVRIVDSVGGSQFLPGWLRGEVSSEGFPQVNGDPLAGELVVFPAFNQLVGGTAVNIESQQHLCPFLPDGIQNGELYLLDGTRLGPYREV